MLIVVVVARTDIVSKLTSYNPNLDALLGGSTDVTATLIQLNGQVQAQAAMIAYIDDFKLMMWLTLAAIPLIFLLRKPGAPAGGGHAAPAME
ncbi:MAG TPA: hypothetical protein VM891_04615 [Amaricoccus sp.]|jgi:DHA2 family multidrug resistance protein|nr:hypothetical protein [Amaricoccus sp.]